MRLEKIKLAGFKSFVDPTTAEFPTNLVGVVGPNGCGKSNIIDAVRWVMGESSAKMLRGESMADVIFNGSSTRKPVGTATIELLFDNSSGTAGGQYASYAEISVKRQVTRDGQSNYFLNSVRCRRRDITDLFLGTGLGPRSYSIIEQGMISRIIEARPEDLRVYLEEAAGISKYKERRRETENRIRHTRENLERLTDLIDEVGKQLKHLERQAATAEKYRILKEEERRLRGEYLSLRWKVLRDDLQKHDRVIADKQNQLEASIAKQRATEALIEEQRSAHADANDAFNQVQGQFYALGADIARLEQTIQFARETRQKQQSELEQVERSLQHLRQEQVEATTHHSQIKHRLAEKTPHYNTMQTDKTRMDDALHAAEHAMQAWQQAWDAFNQEANEPAQTAQVERTRINYIEAEEAKLQQRLNRNQDERARLQTTDLLREINELDAKIAALLVQQDSLQNGLAQTQQQIVQLRQQQDTNRQQLNQAQHELQSAVGRLASLEALREAALTSGEAGQSWLQEQDLTHANRLAQDIRVSEQWRLALEVVLGHHLQAVCIDDLDAYGQQVRPLENGMVELFASRHDGQTIQDANFLLQHVDSEYDLSGLLHGVRLATHLQDALLRRGDLQLHESFVTPDGVWVAQDWIRFGQEAGAQLGVLDREEEIRSLKSTVQLLQVKVEELQELVRQGQEKLHAQEAQREQQQQSLNQLNTALAEARTQLSNKHTRLDHINGRIEHVDLEIAELQQMIQEGRLSIEQSSVNLHQALEAIETMGRKRSELVAQRDILRQQLDTARQQVTELNRSLHALELELQSLASQHESLSATAERLVAQIHEHEIKHAALAESLAGTEQPIEAQKQQLASLLEQRLQVENSLTAARQQLESIEASLRENEKERQQDEQLVNVERGALEQARMQRQEILVRSSTVEEQLTEGQYEHDALLAELDASADAEQWHAKVEEIGGRIARLGAINLAAIDEFKEQSERMDYLDAQRADVNKSLDTLEEAIRKIDRETRTRFKETFEMVNSGIKELFPKLFGGGHAYLELTGDDLLDTGVTVMARPPGKRNSSIHLLSGGEKALTAVAMVFAIFRLNPAPFCMLDEVDAPLDDANVGRFCHMVKEMSDKVQFIFITHNKITMELSNQLQGVTMHEPGVSRLVSVDIEEAAQMVGV